MADRVKGITIELNGDTTKLSSALKGVNSEVRTTQAALTDVKKLLKLDPSNTELLKQKQRLLGEQIQNTRSKLDELKKAQDAMDATSVDKSSQEYMALRREIIDTEDSLQRLERAASQTNVALEQVAAVAGKISDGARKVSEATAGISTAAGGVLVALGGAAYSAVTMADDLNTLAQQTGFTTNELQKMQLVGDLVDVSMESITGAATKLKKQMASNNDLFQQLGISIKDSSGQMRDTSDVFWDVIERLSHVGNETERDQIAMELLGKSADSLAGIIDDGGAAWRMYAESAERAGLIMSQEVLDSLGETNDKLDILKATAKATLTQTGAKALEAFLPVLERILACINGIFTWIGNLNAEQIQTIVVIAAIVAAISPIAGIIASIAGAVQALIPLVQLLFGAVLANPIAAGIALIALLVAGLVIAIIASWDELKIAWRDLVEEIKREWQAMCDFVKSEWDTFVSYLQSAMAAVGEFLKGIGNGVVGFLEGAINSGIDLINSLIEAVNAAANAIAGLFGGSFGGFGTIGHVNIPRFAKGGSITNGTALVGEAGPELLTVAQGKATVQPLTATIDNKSLAALAGGGSQQVNVNVQFTGSLSQLAAVLQPAISAETTRRGTSLIG